MLEQLLIFTRGGLILWTCKELGNALKGSPIDTLIRSCLLEERSAETSYQYDSPGAAYTLKWTFHNDLGLIFVAVYQRILHLLYVDDLLASVKKDFSSIYDPKRTAYNDFDEAFRQLRAEAEARGEEMRKMKQSVGRGPVVRGGKKQGQIRDAKNGLVQGVGKKGGKSGKSGGGKADSNGDSGKKNDSENRDSKSANGHTSNGYVDDTRVVLKSKENSISSSNGGAFDVNKLQKLRAKGNKKTGDINTVTKVSSNINATKKKPTKLNRVWDDAPSKAKLDFTDPVDGRGDEKVQVVVANEGESMMDKDEVFSSESESESEGEQVHNAKTGAKKKGWFSSVFQR